MQLSSILKSKRATAVSIKIIDVFVQLRELLVNTAEMRLDVEKIRNKVDNQDKNIEVIFRYFDELLDQKQQPRKSIGYKILNDENEK